MFTLPGRSYRGPFLPLTSEEIAVRELLHKHVATLASTIGERHVQRASSLGRAADYIERQLTDAGYSPRSQEYSAQGTRVRNVEAALAGSRQQMLVIGAHYDSVIGCPGANDNASGVAAMLVIAGLLARQAVERTVRFVAFVNEEPPFFMSDAMGSVVSARACRARSDDIFGMFSLETIGYYSDEPGSQQYPGPAVCGRLYPDTGNFIGFVANLASRRLMRMAGREFRRTTQFPSEGAAAPADIPGVGWSDHWSFWQAGYSAVMLTDTAPYRYPHYHRPTDTSDKLNYDALARVVCGLSRTFLALAQKGG